MRSYRNGVYPLLFTCILFLEESLGDLEIRDDLTLDTYVAKKHFSYGRLMAM